MQRVVILGPGASGKSTLALQLGAITGLPVIELDKIFWRPELAATPRDQWVQVQQQLIQSQAWILDGDLGPHDALEIRLRAADTIIFLDFSLVRCAWRAVRRARERWDFWTWMLRYRRDSRPQLLDLIARHGEHAAVHVLGNPEAVRAFLSERRTG